MADQNESCSPYTMYAGSHHGDNKQSEKKKTSQDLESKVLKIEKDDERKKSSQDMKAKILKSGKGEKPYKRTKIAFRKPIVPESGVPYIPPREKKPEYKEISFVPLSEQNSDMYFPPTQSFRPRSKPNLALSSTKNENVDHDLVVKKSSDYFPPTQSFRPKSKPNLALSSTKDENVYRDPIVNKSSDSLPPMQSFRPKSKPDLVTHFSKDKNIGHDSAVKEYVKSQCVLSRKSEEILSDFKKSSKKEQVKVPQDAYKRSSVKQTYYSFKTAKNDANEFSESKNFKESIMGKNVDDVAKLKQEIIDVLVKACNSKDSVQAVQKKNINNMQVTKSSSKLQNTEETMKFSLSQTNFKDAPNNVTNKQSVQKSNKMVNKVHSKTSENAIREMETNKKIIHDDQDKSIYMKDYPKNSKKVQYFNYIAKPVEEILVKENESEKGSKSMLKAVTSEVSLHKSINQQCPDDFKKSVSSKKKQQALDFNTIHNNILNSVDSPFTSTNPSKLDKKTELESASNSLKNALHLLYLKATSNKLSKSESIQSPLQNYLSGNSPSKGGIQMKVAGKSSSSDSSKSDQKEKSKQSESEPSVRKEDKLENAAYTKYFAKESAKGKVDGNKQDPELDVVIVQEGNKSYTTDEKPVLQTNETLLVVKPSSAADIKTSSKPEVPDSSKQTETESKSKQEGDKAKYLTNKTLEDRNKQDGLAKGEVKQRVKPMELKYRVSAEETYQVGLNGIKAAKRDEMGVHGRIKVIDLRFSKGEATKKYVSESHEAKTPSLSSEAKKKIEAHKKGSEEYIKQNIRDASTKTINKNELYFPVKRVQTVDAATQVSKQFVGQQGVKEAATQTISQNVPNLYKKQVQTVETGTQASAESVKQDTKEAYTQTIQYNQSNISPRPVKTAEVATQTPRENIKQVTKEASTQTIRQNESYIPAKQKPAVATQASIQNVKQDTKEASTQTIRQPAKQVQKLAATRQVNGDSKNQQKKADTSPLKRAATEMPLISFIKKEDSFETAEKRTGEINNKAVSSQPTNKLQNQKQTKSVKPDDAKPPLKELPKSANPIRIVHKLKKPLEKAQTPHYIAPVIIKTFKPEGLHEVTQEYIKCDYIKPEIRIQAKPPPAELNSTENAVQNTGYLNKKVKTTIEPQKQNASMERKSTTAHTQPLTVGSKKPMKEPARDDSKPTKVSFVPQKPQTSSQERIMTATSKGNSKETSHDDKISRVKLTSATEQPIETQHSSQPLSQRVGNNDSKMIRIVTSKRQNTITKDSGETKSVKTKIAIVNTEQPMDADLKPVSDIKTSMESEKLNAKATNQGTGGLNEGDPKPSTAERLIKIEPVKQAAKSLSKNNKPKSGVKSTIVSEKLNITTETSQATDKSNMGNLKSTAKDPMQAEQVKISKTTTSKYDESKMQVNQQPDTKTSGVAEITGQKHVTDYPKMTTKEPTKAEAAKQVENITLKDAELRSQVKQQPDTKTSMPPEILNKTTGQKHITDHPKVAIKEPTKAEATKLTENMTLKGEELRSQVKQQPDIKTSGVPEITGQEHVADHPTVATKQLTKAEATKQTKNITLKGNELQVKQQPDIKTSGALEITGREHVGDHSNADTQELIKASVKQTANITSQGDESKSQIKQKLDIKTTMLPEIVNKATEQKHLTSHPKLDMKEPTKAEPVQQTVNIITKDTESKIHEKSDIKTSLETESLNKTTKPVHDTKEHTIVDAEKKAENMTSKDDASKREAKQDITSSETPKVIKKIAGKKHVADLPKSATNEHIKAEPEKQAVKVSPKGNESKIQEKQKPVLETYFISENFNKNYESSHVFGNSNTEKQRVVDMEPIKAESAKQDTNITSKGDESKMQERQKTTIKTYFVSESLNKIGKSNVSDTSNTKYAKLVSTERIKAEPVKQAMNITPQEKQHSVIKTYLVSELSKKVNKASDHSNLEDPKSSTREPIKEKHTSNVTPRGDASNKPKGNVEPGKKTISVVSAVNLEQNVKPEDPQSTVKDGTEAEMSKEIVNKTALDSKNEELSKLENAEFNAKESTIPESTKRTVGKSTNNEKAAAASALNYKMETSRELIKDHLRMEQVMAPDLKHDQPKVIEYYRAKYLKDPVKSLLRVEGLEHESLSEKEEYNSSEKFKRSFPVAAKGRGENAKLQSRGLSHVNRQYLKPENKSLLQSNELAPTINTNPQKKDLSQIAKEYVKPRLSPEIVEAPPKYDLTMRSAGYIETVMPKISDQNTENFIEVTRTKTELERSDADMKQTETSKVVKADNAVSRETDVKFLSKPEHVLAVDIMRAPRVVASDPVHAEGLKEAIKDLCLIESGNDIVTRSFKEVVPPHPKQEIIYPLRVSSSGQNIIDIFSIANRTVSRVEDDRLNIKPTTTARLYASSKGDDLSLSESDPSKPRSRQHNNPWEMDDPQLQGISRYFNSATIRGRANTMAGDSHAEESQFKGLSKYFNGTTLRGRANVAKATYASVGLLILYFTMKPKKK